MDKFFERLLDQESYGELLREHLDGYVEEIVKKKYHILRPQTILYLQDGHQRMSPGYAGK